VLPPAFSGVMALAMQIAPFVLAPAHAEGAVTLGCVGAGAAVSCGAAWGAAGDPYIRKVPAPHTAEEQAQYDAHDRQWLARCRPVIHQDQYGVARYHYAAPGCEFGVIGE
jgi:hypothetical protein